MKLKFKQKWINKQRKNDDIYIQANLHIYNITTFLRFSS